MNAEARLGLFLKRNGVNMSHHHSKHGYSRWDLISALHKSIRKGDERRATAYALEMACTSKAWHSMVCNYFENVVHEDISVADMQTAVYVMTTVRYLRDYYNRKQALENMGLANCVIALCRAKKSHDGLCLSEVICSELGCMEWRDGTEGKVPEFPDYIFDMHTEKGKKLGRGWEHFLKECFWDMHNEDDDAKYREEFDDLVLNRTKGKKTLGAFGGESEYKFEEPEIKRPVQGDMFD
jgi:replication-associated recombination protein RarA